MLVPLAAAALVLAVALAGYVMVKFYGVIFLGRPREPHLVHAHDPGWLERVALAALAAACVALGLFPSIVLTGIGHVTALLAGSLPGGADTNWLVLAPLGAERSSYAPLIVLAAIVATVLIAIQIVHRVWHGRVRVAPAWDCGFPLQTARMQDTAEGFGQPIRQVFEPFFRMQRHLPSPRDAAPHYSVEVSDPWWAWIYVPIAAGTAAVSRAFGVIQGGRIGVYLTFSFVTLIALLLFVL